MLLIILLSILLFIIYSQIVQQIYTRFKSKETMKNKDKLWTTPVTFVSSANSALLCNSSVDFVDIDHVSFNISLDKLEKKLSLVKKKSNLPKIIMPVHLAGNPVNLLRLKKLSYKYKFKIIEDASHASGTKLKNSMIGSCKYSDNLEANKLLEIEVPKLTL